MVDGVCVVQVAYRLNWVKLVLARMYGHFGAKALRHQDISGPEERAESEVTQKNVGL